MDSNGIGDEEVECFIGALTANSSLEILDSAGSVIGYKGAELLSQCFQVNNTFGDIFMYMKRNEIMGNEVLMQRKLCCKLC